MLKHLLKAAYLTEKSNAINGVLIALYLLQLPSLGFSQQMDKETRLEKTASKGLNGVQKVAGNALYEIVIEALPGAGVGLYTLRTGPQHPITEQFNGEPQDLLFGGKQGDPGTSYWTIRSYSTKTDYVQIDSAASAFQLVMLDSTFDEIQNPDPVKPILNDMDTTGFRISYVLPGFVVVPDQIRITQIVDVHGTNFDNSWIENTISVTNLGDSFTEIGIRLLTDISIANDDTPKLFKRVTLDDFGDTERSFIRPDFDFFVATANDVDEASPRTYQVFGSVVIPEHLAENSLNPEVLQFVSWSQAFFQAFDYQVNPVLNITSEEVPNAGNATQMYWGTTPNSPLVIQPGDSVRVTQALVASLPGAEPAILGRVLFGVDGDDNRLVRLNVSAVNPPVEVLGTVVDGTKAIVDTEAMTWDPVSGSLLVISNEDDGPLYMIDPDDINGNADIPSTLVGNTDSDEIEGMAVNPLTGELFGVDNESHKLVKIDLSTGVATEIGKLGFKDVEGLAFTVDPNPVLYGADTKTGKLITIDISTGTGTPVHPTNTIGFPDVECLAFAQDSTLFGFSNGNAHKFITIDTTTGIGSEFPTAGSNSLDIEGVTFILPVELFAGPKALFTGVEDLPPSVPEDFTLEQSYPNPFNPTTNIRFQINNEVHVQLRIYNLKGELVRVLVNEAKLPGQYEVVWDGTNDKGKAVSSGVYLYTLYANEQKSTKKMALIR